MVASTRLIASVVACVALAAASVSTAGATPPITVSCGSQSCSGGGGWSGCKEAREVASNGGGIGGYNVAWTLHWCSNGSSVYNCQVWSVYVDANPYWYWQGWISYPHVEGGGTQCSAYGQGHMKYSRPGLTDIQEFPWIRITGNIYGSATSSQGH